MHHPLLRSGISIVRKLIPTRVNKNRIEVLDHSSCNNIVLKFNYGKRFTLLKVPYFVRFFDFVIRGRCFYLLLNIKIVKIIIVIYCWHIIINVCTEK